MAETNDGPPGNHERRALPTGTRVQEFEILQLIGVGGFGIVYLAQDHSLGRRVALKEYMPPMASRANGTTPVTVTFAPDWEAFAAGMVNFLKEARLLARFDHPALVKVYRFWEENGTAYMVMPYYEGPTLQGAVLDGSFAAGESALRQLLASLLDALALLHADSVYHRDIAPDNILLTANGPVLLDFGAARAAIGSGSQNFTVVLKEGYAPAEQYATEGAMAMRQGPWTDIYALGGVVRYVLTGSKPMSAVARVATRLDPQEPLARVAAGRCSDAFLRAIDTAMALYVEERPQDIAQFRALLSSHDTDPAAAAGEALPPPPKAPQEPPPAPPPAAARGPMAVPALLLIGQRAVLAARGSLVSLWHLGAALKAAMAAALVILAAGTVAYRIRSHSPRPAPPVVSTQVRQSPQSKSSFASADTAVAAAPAVPPAITAEPPAPAESASPAEPAPPVRQNPSRGATPVEPGAMQSGLKASNDPHSPKAAAAPAPREPNGPKVAATGALHEAPAAKQSASASSSSSAPAVAPAPVGPPPAPPPATQDVSIKSEGDPGAGLESASGASGLTPVGPPPVALPEPPPSRAELEYALAVSKSVQENNRVSDTPAYQAALRKGAEVVVSFELDRSGKVSQVFVDRPSGSVSLDKLAMRIVSQARYPPFPPDAWPGKPRRVFTKTFKFR